MAAIVRVEQLDGGWQELDTIGDPVVSADDWGHLSCSFTVAADSSLPQAALSADTPLEIEDEGVSIFEGFVQQTPEEQDDNTISVQGQGLQFCFDDDLIERNWVHAALAEWQDARQYPQANLANYPVDWAVDAGQGVITLQVPDGYTAPTGTRAAVWLDLGRSDAKRVSVDFVGGGTAGLGLHLRAGDAPGIADEFLTVDAAPVTTGDDTVTVGLTANRRYLSIEFVNDSAGGIAGAAGTWVRITGVRVYRQTAYEQSDQSILKPEDIVKDVLASVSRVSQDTSEIEATGLSLPAAGTGGSSMSPRQVVEQWNQSVGYQARVRPLSKRLQYRARPTVPKFKVGAWASERFRHAALSSRDGLFNRVIVRGQDLAGFPVRVERHAADLPGAAAFAERVTSPAPTNPSFDTNTAGWTPSSGTTITRDTTTFDTSPASGRWEQGGAVIGIGEYVEAAFTGTFKRGVPYLLTFRRKTTFTGLVSSSLSTLFGAVSAGDYTQFDTKGGAAPWGSETVVWVPQADSTTVVMRLRIRDLGRAGGGTTQLFVDSLTLAVSKPTLLDRRGTIRATEIQASGTIDSDTAQDLADTFLAESLTTPLQGTLPMSPGEVRDYLTDEPIHPRQLVNEVGEVIHFAKMIDPVTGAHGRDGRIVAVNDYNTGAGTAELEITEQRTSFDRLLAQHDVVAGG